VRKTDDAVVTQYRAKGHKSLQRIGCDKHEKTPENTSSRQQLATLGDFRETAVFFMMQFDPLSQV